MYTVVNPMKQSSLKNKDLLTHSLKKLHHVLWNHKVFLLQVLMNNIWYTLFISVCVACSFHALFV